MYKIKATILVLISLFLFAACGNSYKADRSYMTQENRNREEGLLNEAKTKLSSAKTDDEKQNQLFEIAFRYQVLGDYDSAINYYEQVLNLDPLNYQTLNNIAAIYDEMDETVKALKYEQKLYEKYPTDKEVVGDTINLLVKNKQFDEANVLLETYAKSSVAKENLQFISDEHVFILGQQEREKTVK